MYPPRLMFDAHRSHRSRETKTVNAWFQNKRASTKKRNRATPPGHSTPAMNDRSAPEKSSKQPLPSNLPSIANLLNSTSPVPAAQHPPHSSRPRSHTASTRRSRQKDLHLNDRILADPRVSMPHTQIDTQEATLESSFFVGPSEFFGQDRITLSHHRGHDPGSGAVHPLHNADPDRMLPDTDSRFVSENDALPSRRGRNEVARMRTSPEQAEELRRAYAINDHPTRDQRQQLADRIGMYVISGFKPCSCSSCTRQAFAKCNQLVSEPTQSSQEAQRRVFFHPGCFCTSDAATSLWYW